MGAEMRVFRRLLPVLVMTLGLGVGCEAPGVGDPCEPEQVPLGGFNPAESYLETSSVQCRTRVCMVYQFSGDPSVTREECLEDPMGRDCNTFPSKDAVDERVYCTCRCSAPAESNTPVCECPGGFTCVDDLLSLGGDGIRGGYCVRTDTVDEET